MRSVAKKIYISILTSVLVLVTSLATTYAWVGIFTYSETERVDINIVQPSKNKNDFLVVSASGEENSFSDSISSSEIKTQIIKNMYKNDSKFDDSLVDYTNANSIDKFFNDKANLVPVTPLYDENGKLLYDKIGKIKFGQISNYTYSPVQYTDTNKYFKFDIYLAADTQEGIKDETFIDASIALNEIANTLEGTDSNYVLINGNTLTNNPNRPEDLNKYPELVSLPKKFKTNSANATRLALELYEPIDIKQNYNDQHPFKTLIFQGGKQEPGLENGVYNLGGILPEEYNLAVQEQNKIYDTNLVMGNETRNRQNTDLELTYENRIIYTVGELENNYLGVKDGKRTKMKISVYFWYEGWDADCIQSVDYAPVNINLSFTSDIKN